MKTDNSILENAAIKHAEFYYLNDHHTPLLISEGIAWENRKSNFIEGANWQKEQLLPLLQSNAELFQMVRDLKDCIKRLTEDNLSQYERDTEAEWIGEAHELLLKINPNYYRNANE